MNEARAGVETTLFSLVGGLTRSVSVAAIASQAWPETTRSRMSPRRLAGPRRTIHRAAVHRNPTAAAGAEAAEQQ